MKMHPDYPYLYETHLHTAEGSACAKSSAADLALAAKKFGYTGIFVTDHHFGGNTAVPRDLPWREWVKRFSKGYREAKRMGDLIDLQVFYGWESGFHHIEFLIYGLSEEWMADHPELAHCSVKEQYELVHAAGGLVMQAHPYREAYYIPKLIQYPDDVDGIEGINAQHTNNAYGAEHYNPVYNEKALAYAHEHDFFMCAGSDLHHAGRILGGGVAFAEKLKDSADFIERLRSRKGYLLTDGVSWYDPAGNVVGAVEA